METNIAGAAQADARNDASTTTGYDINSYPTVLDTILTINYYDDYTFPGAGTYASTATGISVQTKGLHTGSKVNVLNTGTMLLTENYYDSEGRLRESIAQNNIGGYDRTVNDYNFNNQLVQSVRTHNSATVSNLVVTNQFVYDHMGRKTHTLQQTGTGQPMVVISKEDYNEIGQLKAKHLHGTINGSDTTYLQDVKYTYNERGWLSSANAPLFAEQLQYNSGTTPQYNGNISQMNYSGPNSGSKVFNYAYDPLNRLTAATSTSNALNESMSYDAMGNITALTRTGARSATLAYTYTGNQLQSVTNSGSAFRSYTYDANGNATGDTTGRTISYNMLNLPQSVVKSGTTVATYTYDADGQKLKNTGTDGSWDYDAGIVYHNGALDFISTEVGRITTNGSNYTYQYNLPDHLGNNRVSFYSNSGAASLLQEDEYYSFGLRKSLYDNSNNNRYLYNGKEVQTDLKDQYDYGARFYDPVIGRFGTIDRYAEKYDALTPYQYGGLNPVSTIDMNGDSIEIIYDHQAILYERGELYGTDGKKYTGNGAKIGKVGNVSGYKGFLGETKKALDQIGSGKNGNELLSNIENAKDIAYIRESGDGSQTNGLIIKWDPYNREGGPDEFGAQDRDPFLSLGHELAHFLDGINGTLDRTTWYTTSTGTQIPNAEKYSTWWENRIRAEHGMNLREYYGIDNGKNVGRILIPFTNHLGGASTVNSIPVGPIFIPYFYSKQTP
jgi:RHS repeat-associated protein